MAKHGIIVQYTMNMHKWMTGQQTQEVPSGNLLHRYVKSLFFIGKSSTHGPLVTISVLKFLDYQTVKDIWVYYNNSLCNLK